MTSAAVCPFQEQAQEHNQKLVAQLTEIAHSYGITAAQLALAWVMAKGEDIVPIPGASKVHHLEEKLCRSECRPDRGGQ